MDERSFRNPKLREAVADCLQDVRGSRGQGRAVRDHDRRGAPARARGVRRLLARLDAGMDSRGGEPTSASSCISPARSRGSPQAAPRCSPPGCACGCGSPVAAMLLPCRLCSPRRLARVVRRRRSGPRARLCRQRTGRAPALLLSRAVAQRHRVVADAVAATATLASWPVASPGGRMSGRSRARCWSRPFHTRCSVRIARRLSLAGGARLRDTRTAPARTAPRRQPQPSRRRPGRVADLPRDVWPIGAGIVLSALYFRIDVFLVQSGRARSGGAVQRGLPAGRSAAAVSGRGAGGGAAVAVPRRDLRPLVRVVARVTGVRGAGGAVAGGSRPVARAVRSTARRYARRGPGVPDPAAVVSADVAQLRADASAHRLARPARVCRDLRDRACRQPGAQRPAHSRAGRSKAPRGRPSAPNCSLTAGCVVALLCEHDARRSDRHGCRRRGRWVTR